MLNTLSFKKIGALVALAGAGVAAQASVVVMDFNHVVTGATPVGSAPWARLTITDLAPNQVGFKLDNLTTAASGQFISELELNMTSHPSMSTIVSDARFNGAPTFGNDFLNDASLKFDVDVKFQVTNSGGGVHRLSGGRSANWTFQGSGITAATFNTFATGNPSNVRAMLHMQGIPQGEGSGKLNPVPEPTSMATLAIGGIALLRRRRKN